MKKHMRGMRILCILIAILLAVQTGGILSGSGRLDSYAASNGDFTFIVSGGTATITAYNVSYGAIADTIVIPATVTDGTKTYTVTGLGESCFSELRNLGSIIIPTSVTSIGDLCFFDCESLTSITIPKSVTSIGKGAFDWCDSLTQINVTSGNANYSSLDGVLYNADKSKLILCPHGKTGSFTIPGSVTSISAQAFAGCNNLTSITIPNSVTSLEDSGFSYCNGLTQIIAASGNPNYSSLDGVLYNADKSKIILCPHGIAGSFTLPSSVKSLGDNCFFYCNNLTSINIPDGVTILGDGCFLGCDSLTSIIIPSSVESIGEQSFSYCGGLTDITIPSSVTSIGTEAFAGCSFNSITIPSSVTSLSSEAFQGLYSLTQITVASGNPNYSSSSGILYNYDKSALIRYPRAKTGSFNIPASVKSIGNYCFQDCTGLTAITIPTSVTSIGNYCFQDCTSLTSIVIPNGATILGVRCFANCEKLTSITIPTSVKSLGNYCFSGCSSLIGITIPISVTSIGAEAFAGCSFNSITIPSSVTSLSSEAFQGLYSLTQITVASGNPNYSSSSGILYNYDMSALIQYPRAKTGSFNIPASVKSIGNYCFQDCTGLTAITIPTSVTSIGKAAFSGCSSLTSITIPTSVTSIADECFGGCLSLARITIPTGVVSIGERAFSSCDSLISITIPSTVTRIGTHAFEDVEFTGKLKTAIFLGNAPVMGPYVFHASYEGHHFLPDGFKVYYLVGKTGFTNPWNGYTTVKSAQVKYNSQGGSTVGAVIVNYNALVKAPTSPTKAGYTFAGWYKEAACTNAWNFSTNKATANITLYAKWKTPINSAKSNSYTSIKVSWSGAGSASSYRIYRATSATGTYTLVKTASSTARSWVDTGQTTGKTYYYKVNPVAGGKEYKFSTYKSAKAVPAASTLTLHKASSKSIKVSWTGVSGATKYQVYRSTSAKGTYSLVYTASSTAKSWTNSGLTTGKTYYYKVRAYHLEGKTKVYGSYSSVKSSKL